MNLKIAYRISLVIYLFIVLGCTSSEKDLNYNPKDISTDNKEDVLKFNYNGCGKEEGFLLYTSTDNGSIFLIVTGDVSSFDYDKNYQIDSDTNENLMIFLDYYPSDTIFLDYCSDVIISNNLKQRINSISYNGNVKKGKTMELSFVSIEIKEVVFYNEFTGDTVLIDNVKFDNIVLNNVPG